MIHLRLATRAIPGSTNDPHNAGIREPRTGPGLEGGLNYAPIAKPFLENPQEFAVAFAKAWYKVTHRDLEPVARYLGPDAVAAVDHPLMGEAERAAPKVEILASWLSILELV